MFDTPKWRNWQTRRTQNPVAFGPCGFDSRLRHSRKAPEPALFSLRRVVSTGRETGDGATQVGPGSAEPLPGKETLWCSRRMRAR